MLSYAAGQRLADQHFQQTSHCEGGMPPRARISTISCVFLNAACLHPVEVCGDTAGAWIGVGRSEHFAIVENGTCGNLICATLHRANGSFVVAPWRVRGVPARASAPGSVDVVGSWPTPLVRRRDVYT